MTPDELAAVHALIHTQNGLMTMLDHLIRAVELIEARLQLLEAIARASSPAGTRGLPGTATVAARSGPPG